MRYFLSLLALSLLLFSWTTCHGQSKPAPEVPAKPVVVPFELLRTKHIAVKIKVNGKGPFRVIFDTGAPMTVLTSKLAREAGLATNRPAGGFGLFGAGGGPMTIKSLMVGDLEAKDVQGMVMDHPTVRELALALGPLEGIVGFPFFARYRTTIDYQEKTLTFVPSGFDPPNVYQLMTKEVEALMGRPGAASLPRVLAPAALWGLSVTREKDDPEPGVVIKEVVPNSAAAMGGLKKGDRLLTVDGRWTDSVSDLYHAAGLVKAGRMVKVVVLRDKKELTLNVTPTFGL